MLFPEDVRLKQVAKRRQALVETGLRVGFHAANHCAHGIVVRKQRLYPPVAVRYPMARDRKDVRLFDLEVRTQVGLEELDEPRHLLRSANPH